MKRKLIETGQDLLIILINHLFFVGFGMTAMGLFYQDVNELFLWSCMVVIPYAMYLFRLKIKNFFLFFLLHLAIPVGVFFLPVWILPRILAFVISVVYMVWSIKIRLKDRFPGEEILSPIFILGALGFMAIIDTMHTKKGWEGIFIYMAILYIAGYCIYIYTSRYLNFLVVNESSAANIPEQQIFVSGMKQTLVFLAGGLCILLMTANVGWLSYLVSGFGRMFLAFMRAVFAGIHQGQQEEPIVEDEVVDQGGDGGGLFGEPVEPALIWVILEKIAMVATAILIVSLIVLMIYKGIKFLWDNFHTATVNEDRKIEDGVDIREACVIEKQSKESRNIFAFLSNREKIRRYYRKQMTKQKAIIIGDQDLEMLEYMTAKECCDKLAAENLKKVYEKSRYSKEEITSEDMKLAKSGN